MQLSLKNQLAYIYAIYFDLDFDSTIRKLRLTYRRTLQAIYQTSIKQKKKENNTNYTTQYYVKKSKFREKITVVVNRQPQKNIHYLKNFYRYTFSNNSRLPNPYLHEPRKIFLNKVYS